MSVISEVKCGRCDRKYSGFRSRCPYCGARRSKRGKHADEVDNAKAKLVIGIVLLVVLIGATMVLIFTSVPHPDDTGDVSASAEPTTPTDAEQSNTSLATEDTSPSPSPSPSPSQPVEIASVVITWQGNDKTDVTMDYITQTLHFSFRTIPETTEEDLKDMDIDWKSSKEDVFAVVNGDVTAISQGDGTLTCTVNGVPAECTIRVPNKLPS